MTYRGAAGSQGKSCQIHLALRPKTTERRTDACRATMPGALAEVFYPNAGSGSPIGRDSVIIVQLPFSVAIAPIVTSVAREGWRAA
jgi:hypothetical protein